MLSVIVPAFNEARRLPATLQALRVYLDGAGEEYEEYEVIVVDDGSRDGTAQLAEQTAAGWDQLQVIRLPQNRGKGAAVRAGMLAELAKLRELIEGTTAVVIGSRAVDASEVEVHQPFSRELMGRSYNRMLQLLVLPGLHDTQCGFKLFTAEAAMACFTPLRTPGFGFDAEVLLRARRLGWSVAEVGVVWRHAENSRVSPIRDSLGILVDLIRLRLRRD
jgi:dolichyl-phosphate beta-glucosyltransferase